MTKKITINVYHNLLGENERWAKVTKKLLRSHNIAMFNLIGSPGAGKTRLLEASVSALKEKTNFAVLEGDVATRNDAERLAKLGCKVSQLLTDGACHLTARLVHRALSDLELKKLNLVMVENVGNLVCPAEFDIGEDAKIAVLSVTEGEDKPAKYPALFREAKAVVLTKVDLIPYLKYNITQCLDYLKKINPYLSVFMVSAETGSGIDRWIDFISSHLQKKEGKEKLNTRTQCKALKKKR
jgi:hydrogenase nickel incorporation protein HypB